MEKRLYRKKPGVLGGVCNGLAEYLDIDVTIVRLLWVLSILVVGFGVLLYLVMWIVVPEYKEQEPVDAESENKKE